MGSPDLAGRLVLFGLRFLGKVESRAPRGVRFLGHHLLAGVLWVGRLRIRVVRQNLEIAYPGVEGKERRERLEWQAYLHLARLIFEVPMLLGDMARVARERVEFRGLEIWREASSRGRGVLFLSSHVGNWEVMAAAGAANGMDLMIVTKHLKPEWLHRAIEEGRRRSGVEATYEPRTLKDVFRWLQKGGTVGFVLDQYAGPPVGIRVPVFGVPTGTHSAPAMIARRTGAVVLPVVNFRKPDGSWVVEVRPEIPPVEGTEELARQTALYSKVLEQDIRAHPEQWLWIHKRFKGDQSPIREGEWSERSR